MFNGTTTTEMSSSERAKCRERIRHQWENRKVDEALLQCAWKAAQRVATVLYQNYGASKVAVFGSLAEREWFHEHSDIDIAVWGIPDDSCLKTICEKVNLNSKHHRIDLIDYESVKDYFLSRVKRQAIHIKKCEKYTHKLSDGIYPTTSNNIKDIYKKYINRFVQHIDDQRHKINCIVTRIKQILEKTPDNSAVISEDDKITLADDVAKIYQTIVKILLWILLHVDNEKFPQDEYKYNLLAKMTEHIPQRPPAISHKNAQKLKPLLKFRNRVNVNNPIEFDNEDIVKHAKQVEDSVESVFEELDTFVAFLSET